jgi:uncharacterized membrane protein YkoI
MRRRTIVVALVAGLAVLAALTAASFAFGGPRGLIWDDGHYAKPGSLDDGKDLLAQTSVSLPAAVATARHAAGGALGQVDLEHFHGGIVYMVDVGSQEVRVDATSGEVVAIASRD